MTAARGSAYVRLAGLLALLAGALLLAGVAVYYAYGLYAGSRLDRFNVSGAEAAAASADNPNRGVFEPVLLTERSSSADSPDRGVFEPVLLTERSSSAASAAGAGLPRQAGDEAFEPAEPPQPDRPVFDSSFYETVYPGFQIHPKYWGSPLWAGSEPYPHVVTGLPSGFRGVESGAPAFPASPGGVARIGIPIIGVDSAVEELGIVDLGDSQAYENPDNVVGRIPETALPGELGNGWFFGHLESPLRGEGSVFRRLTDIPGHLRDGDPVYVSLESEAAVHLYRVTSTRVVHQDDLRLYDSDTATITLVSCVPRLVYDHRLLVTAELVGVRN